MWEDINNICLQINQCKSCRLHQTRFNAVCGKGKVPSKIMFIAQAPGRIEDKAGKILIGPSGKVFDELLKEINIERNEIYVTNLVKCFLPKCRKPRHDEIEICYNHFLRNEIEIVKPEIIVTLGFHVTRFIFELFGLPVPDKFEIKEVFGKLQYVKSQKILPLKHPATVVHKSKSFEDLLTDYKILKTLLIPCPKHDECEIPKKYKTGLITQDYLEQFCYGNWVDCTIFKKQ
jgi:DNA polymerase